MTSAVRSVIFFPMGDTSQPAVDIAKDVRRQTVQLLDEYIRLAARMSEFENAFLTYVLLPGYQLQMAVKKREFLEREHTRIRENIQWQTYSSAEEIAQDVRRTISRAEAEFSGRELCDKDDEAASRSPVAGLDPGTWDLDLTDEEKAVITAEFKRSVIPRVHADTSAAPFEEFQTVLDAYKKKDFLLMRAFIIRYGDETARWPDEPEGEFLERVARTTEDDRKVLDKLRARIDVLKRNMTARELEDQDEVLRQIKNQNREIQKAIYQEAEELLRIQNRLEDLIRTPFLAA